MKDYYGTIETGRVYLEHFGIKGMHWGVRRFENPDGSLTEAGKRRYSKHSKQKSRFTKAYAIKHPIKVLTSKEAKSSDKKIALMSLAATTGLTVGAARIMPKVIMKGSSRLYKVMNKMPKNIEIVKNMGPVVVDKFGNEITDPEILKRLGML